MRKCYQQKALHEILVLTVNHWYKWKNKIPNTEPRGTPALQIFNLKTNHLIQLSSVCYGQMTELDQEDYHLFHYVLVYTEVLHVKLCQIPLISLRILHVLMVS